MWLWTIEANGFVLVVTGNGDSAGATVGAKPDCKFVRSIQACRDQRRLLRLDKPGTLVTGVVGASAAICVCDAAR